MNAHDSHSLPIECGSPERFGYSWHRYADILPEHEKQFRCWTMPLEPADWHNQRFLDAGCGIGRNSLWPMKYGAAGGLALDVDERTLSAARRNLAPYPSVEVRRQSLYELAEEEAFDIVFSIGVVHHLEFPQEAVARLVRAARPGGRILLWVYGRENNGWIVRFADPLRKTLFSKLPLGIVHALSWPATAALWLALRLGLQQIEYFRLLRRMSFRHLRAIVFDHMIPKIARYYRQEEAIALLKDVGVIDVEAVWVNEMSWTVRGRKPG